MGEFPGLLCDEFRQRDIGCLAYDQVFSPLEDYTTDQLHERILAGGFDSVMFVNDAVSSTNTNDLGSVSQIEPYSGTVTTTNITGFSRSDRFSVVVYDVSTDKKVYLANAETSGGGAMCVNDYVYLRSAAEKIAEDMLK
ncbi:TPA: hypothetical protein KDY90_002563 [Vibrio parahaemolyticus]|nr:hypothetical protein [Vibrio parahaemolyticus]